ncbi:hypothetical protein Mp_1g14300 [Marchantia polymorpha subsp. ruderalis]|uniref:Uncharacterized protein n=2 Tax=Marchantia polymorpha TaxID=3197 RepID=A0AAF6AQ21_MARPO|nr:hypothetical protein MARPO_0179s0011 [Marchantia polymorpha]BBM98541.1 hypothetical protein Mp_1g14300 [Marchantia polymorpha subsp. ruderalis]|eukprot:PTQ27922.1 hypothetical protein MARPO_0179s0011 [Marchantia polymorpha]
MLCRPCRAPFPTSLEQKTIACHARTQITSRAQARTRQSEPSPSSSTKRGAVRFMGRSEPVGKADDVCRSGGARAKRFRQAPRGEISARAGYTVMRAGGAGCGRRATGRADPVVP